MIGKILYFNENYQGVKIGKAEGDDGSNYQFNEHNLAAGVVTMEELSVNQEVEFELSPPNNKGVRYPKNLRPKGAIVPAGSQDDSFKVSHSYGAFKDFVFVNTKKITLAIEQAVSDFCSTEYAHDLTLTFKYLATKYNSLSNEDFVFRADGDDNVVMFPSGFKSTTGDDIFLYCEKNTFEGKSPWYCECVFCNGEVFGRSVFDILKANWYDIEEGIESLVPDIQVPMQEIINSIERRCINFTEALVYLKNGVSCSADTADELYVPTGYYEPGGKEIYLLSTKRNGVKGFGWYYDSPTYENAPIDVCDKREWLEMWGGSFTNGQYEELANQTLDEQWSFGKRTDYGILRNYLKYTFSHQWIKQNISYSSDGQLAAFNTGLPDRNTYKYLYAIFEKKASPSTQELHPLFSSPKYEFKAFTVQGRGGYGKMLSNMRPLPNPPQYFEERSHTVWELDLNDSNQITIPDYDDTHILIKRCDRLPLDFYAYPATKSEKLRQIISSDIANFDKYKAIREFFRPIIENEPDQCHRRSILT